MSLTDERLRQFEIPKNSISCFIGRICSEPSEDFEKDGILYVDFYDLDGSKNMPEHDQEGTTQHLAVASWTIRSAYIAWKKPPKITYKGSAKLKGRITMSNAQLSNVTISGGAPLQGTVTHPYGPGTSLTPVNISNATGTAKIEQRSSAEIEMETDNDNLDIVLTSQQAAQLPWCVNGTEPEEGASLDGEAPFIKEGDKALCLAFGNSLDNLYIVDIFR